MKGKFFIGIIMSLVLSTGMIPSTLPVAVAAGSTAITVTKYAPDGTTVLAQTTVDYVWMEANLAPYGDGVTHYYHQGPTLDPANLWDSGIAPEPPPGETVNVDSNDLGAAVGTDVRDLCAQVGGAPAGSRIEIKAVDNMSRSFAADDINSMVGIRPIIAWKNDTYGGYVPAYSSGMRLIFFDEATNVDGKHVFGHWDMHETMSDAYWYYYDDYGTLYPSTKGLSVKNVDRINIFTVVDVLYDGPVSLTPGGTFEVTSYVADPAGTTYTVSSTTPLGALDTAASNAGFSYVVSDKKMSTKGILLLDDVDVYAYESPGEWYAYVNDVYKDGFANSADALNNLQVVHGDTVEFYYAAGVADPSDLASVQAAAIAAVKTVVSTDVVYECAAAPVDDCVSPQKGILLVNEKKPGKGKLKVGLNKLTEAVSQSDFGGPVDGDTIYTVCVYDDADSLVGQMRVDRAQENCGPKSKPCWTAISDQGYKYKDPDTTADGILSIVAKGGDAGKGKVIAVGTSKAGKLPTGIAAALLNNTKATVQVVSSDAACFGVTTDQVKKADGLLFKALGG